jgi:MFS family permease
VFLIRPLGGLFFGPLADRIGRNRVLAMTMVLMALGTFAIGPISSERSTPTGAPPPAAKDRDSGTHNLAYASRYRVQGDLVIHKPLVSLFPNWEGFDVPRRARVTGETLTL